MARLVEKLRSGNGLRLVLESVAASGISFLAMAVPSAGLPSGEYMLGFYWMQGANIAFFAFEVAALRDVALRQSSDALVRLRWLFRLAGVAGVLFMPRPWAWADVLRGALLGGLVAEVQFRYLLGITQLRRESRFVQAQQVVRRCALFRLAMTLTVVAAVQFRWISLEVLPSTLFVLAVGLSYWPKLSGLSVSTPQSDGDASAPLWLGLRAMVMTLAARAIVPAMTYAVSERFRPLLTVVASGALVLGSLGVQLLLDAGLTAHRRVVAMRGLFAILAASSFVVALGAAFRPDGWAAAVLAGGVAGAASSALVAAAILGKSKSWEQAAFDKVVAFASLLALVMVPDQWRVTAVAIVLPLLALGELRGWLVPETAEGRA